MRSRQITNFPDADRYSELKVMKSAAGFYVGSEYEGGTPGTRDSHYHPNRSATERTLARILRGEVKPRSEP